jgi:hypothetical protein
LHRVPLRLTHITGGNFAQSSITINGWLRDFLWAQATHSILCLFHWLATHSILYWFQCLDFEFDREALFMVLEAKFTSKCIRRLINFDVCTLSTCFLLGS